MPSLSNALNVSRFESFLDSKDDTYTTPPPLAKGIILCDDLYRTGTMCMLRKGAKLLFLSHSQSLFLCCSDQLMGLH